MLMWENSGRGNFEQMQNILINDKNKNDNDFIEKNMHLIKKEILKEKLNLFDQNEIIIKFLRRLTNKKKINNMCFMW